MVPTLLTPKKDRSSRMCVDSKDNSKIMVKYSFPILSFEDMFDYLARARWFSKINLRSIYNKFT